MKSDLWDTSALLALQCAADDFQAAAEAVFDGSCSAARRSRAEFYCAATGRMGVPPEATLALLESLDAFVEWVPLSDADEARVIKSAPKRGLQGRILFDALIAECALILLCYAFLLQFRQDRIGWRCRLWVSKNANTKFPKT
jgi:predicted nucleic acid-binding protein